VTTKTLRIGGMSCNHCVHAVTRALEGVEGVSRAQVELGSGRAVVEYDEARTGVAELVAAVQEEGYSAEESE